MLYQHFSAYGKHPVNVTCCLPTPPSKYRVNANELYQKFSVWLIKHEVLIVGERSQAIDIGNSREQSNHYLAYEKWGTKLSNILELGKLKN